METPKRDNNSAGADVSPSGGRDAVVANAGDDVVADVGETASQPSVADQATVTSASLSGADNESTNLAVKAAETEGVKTEGTKDEVDRLIESLEQFSIRSPVEVAATGPEADKDMGSSNDATTSEANKANIRYDDVVMPEVSSAPLGTSDTAASQNSMIRLIRNSDCVSKLRCLSVHPDEALAKQTADIDRNQHEVDVDKLCVSCNTETNKVCGTCHEARYCSRECQVAGWAIHKLNCRDFAGNAALGKRPSREHRRIVFFPMSGDKPEIYWAVRYKTDSSDYFDFDPSDPKMLMHVAMLNHSGDMDDPVRLDTAVRLPHRRTGSALKYITYAVDDPVYYPTHPKTLNRSIAALSKPGYLIPVYDSIVLFSDLAPSGDAGPHTTRDITPRDIHTYVAFIETCYAHCLSVPARFHGEVVKGIKVNDPKSTHNQAMGVKAVYEHVDVPLNRCVGWNFPIAVAFYMGLRWYVRQSGGTPAIEDTTFWNDGNLRYLAFVAYVGEVPNQKRTPADCLECTFEYGPFNGSVIVMHGSGQPVNLEHLLAFDAYLDEAYIEKRPISRKDFEAFWERYREKAGDRLKDAPSPWQWEGKEYKDRLGVYNPALIRLKVAREIRDIWLKIMDFLNSFHHPFEDSRSV